LSFSARGTGQGIEKILLALLFAAACGGAPETAVSPSETMLPAKQILPTGTRVPLPTSADTSTPSPSPTSAQQIDPKTLATATLIPGPAATLAPIEALIINHGDRGSPMVALTFDIGEKPATPAWYDEDIEAALIEKQAAATFFLGGHWMQRYPEVTRRLASNPLFEIGNHSWAHPDFPDLEYSVISAEITRTNDLYYQLTGKSMSLFRFPAGLHTPYVRQVVADHGMVMIQWDVVTADPVPDNDAENINRRVRDGVQNGSIIVMHANGRGWHTAEALPEMIDWLRAQGYELVTISEILAGLSK